MHQLFFKLYYNDLKAILSYYTSIHIAIVFNCNGIFFFCVFKITHFDIFLLNNSYGVYLTILVRKTACCI